jgi:hypothetical protein
LHACGGFGPCTLVCRISNSASVTLNQLPDPCLLAVMHCCADDLRSLFSAARAHSRLHQAAVLAASSITAVVKQQDLDSVMSYMYEYAQHIKEVDLCGAIDNSWWPDTTLQLHQLPPALQLDSLRLSKLCLQRHPGYNLAGVLGYAGVTALKQLHVLSCSVLNRGVGQRHATDMPQLSAGLDRLSFQYKVQGRPPNSLVALSKADQWAVTADMLPDTPQLTRLELYNQWPFGGSRSSQGCWLVSHGSSTCGCLVK